MRQRTRVILLLAGVTLCLITGGCGGNGAAAPSESEQILINLGARLHQAIAPAVMNDDVNLRRYIQQVGQRLLEAAAEMHRARIGPPAHFSADDGKWMFAGDMRFHLLNSDVTNAFTPGGTHVYVYNGLLQGCRSEEELAAAVAHVYAHLYARHRQQKSALLEDADAKDIVISLINNRHTPQEEQEADVIGFQLFARAGWDPLAYGNLAQRLQQTQRADAARLMAEQLPLAALDWAQPPIADNRQFTEYLRTAQAMAQGTLPDDLRLLLTAVPSCLTSSDLPEQQLAQQQLLSAPVPLETPAAFEKGPRVRPR